MNRGYTAEEYMQKVDHLRQLRPQISITSDIIIGFPGETQNDYQETIDMMEKIRFDSIFSFKYSERKGTVAQKLEGKIEEGEKSRRLTQVQALQDQHTIEANLAMEGSLQELLIEGKSRNSENDLMGRTGSWKIVNFKSDKALAGKIVKAKITKAYLHSLRGKLMEEVEHVN
jgi:tRNA-2-methylthio-N6-dimethylallyladenosine synthase